MHDSAASGVVCNTHAVALSGGADQQCTHRLKTDNQPNTGWVRCDCPQRHVAAVLWLLQQMCWVLRMRML